MGGPGENDVHHGRPVRRPGALPAARAAGQHGDRLGADRGHRSQAGRARLQLDRDPPDRTAARCRPGARGAASSRLRGILRAPTRHDTIRPARVASTVSGPGATCPRVPFGYAFTDYRPDFGRGPGAVLCISPRGGRHPVRTSAADRPHLRVRPIVARGNRAFPQTRMTWRPGTPS
ncbi:Translation initiation factor IF-2 [Blastococcus saxobsidens DD2]|uniref:Translation initiation factor IF-2 n=1 Tax=Blastococcus saxobsidens (strain DD2) TaxID=1146883 RepID=H6RQR3_BLASD|nr:Translation initiation factor IF-2 [Blastococcus saxobsidens DD2]